MPTKNKTTRILYKGLTALCILAAFSLIITAWQSSSLQAPPPSYLLLDTQHQFLGQVRLSNEQEYGYWPLSSIPKRVSEATLALEDKRFWQHPGVDFIAIVRAIGQNIASRKRISGASTIAMQIARMQSQRTRTYWNKATDALAALIMTYRYGRKTLLKHYLKLVPYGNQTHGIRYAARLYFDKPVQDLSWAEIALLSAIPQSPSKMNIYRHAGLQQAKQRGQKALRFLHQQGIIPNTEYSVAQKHLNDFKPPIKPTRPNIAIHPILSIKKHILQQPPPHFTLHTSLNMQLQQQLNTLSKRYLTKWQDKHAVNQMAIIVASATEPKILAMLGSVDFFNSTAGAINYTETLRSPGSTLKPFLFAHALAKQTIKANTLLDDLQVSSWGFNNADRKFLGPLLPRQALGNSRNIPAINLLQRVGLQSHYEFLQQIGLHTHQHPAEYYGLGLALGNLPVTLKNLVTAYHSLVNDGDFSKLSWYTPQHQITKNILPSHAARQISLFLSAPLARLPSFKRMGSIEYPFPVAIKTGTSQNFKDAWTMAYSQKYVIGIWVGRPDAEPMNQFGGAKSAELIKQLMLSLHNTQSDGLSDQSFPAPDGYVAKSICALDGKHSQDCHRTFTEWFPEGNTPELESSFNHYKIDTRNHLLATQWTPKVFQKNVLSLKLPAQYQHWLAENNTPQKPLQYSPLNLPSHINLKPTIFKADIRVKSTPDKLSIKITSPIDNSRLFLSPDTPAEQQTISLRLHTSEVVKQILWSIDGKPYQLTKDPHQTRWVLQPGIHTITATIPFTEVQAKSIKIHVK
ncbi:MAG: glycosyl transferase [Methylococcales bacterium]|nr:glycosyl transferase [Methylococcales bacterium]